MLALTPGFFDKRPSFSSNASCPLAWKLVSRMNPQKAAKELTSAESDISNMLLGARATLIDLAYQLLAWVDRGPRDVAGQIVHSATRHR